MIRVQNSTFKLEHTGYIDDTFHRQELTSSTPRNRPADLPKVLTGNDDRQC